MAIKRWVLRDPSDTNPATNTYTFIRNPREMTSLYQERAITSTPTTAGRILLWEGARNAKQFTFSGPVLEKSLFDALQKWVYKRRRLILTDHYGREISCVLTNIDLVPKRRVGYYYSHEYTVSGLALAIGQPTVDNEGPR